MANILSVNYKGYLAILNKLPTLSETLSVNWLLNMFKFSLFSVAGPIEPTSLPVNMST